MLGRTFFECALIFICQDILHFKMNVYFCNSFAIFHNVAVVWNVK